MQRVVGGEDEDDKQSSFSFHSLLDSDVQIFSSHGHRRRLTFNQTTCGSTHSRSYGLRHLQRRAIQRSRIDDDNDNDDKTVIITDNDPSRTLGGAPAAAGGGLAVAVGRADN